MRTTRTLLPGLAALTLLALSTGCASRATPGPASGPGATDQRETVVNPDGTYTYHYYPSAEVYYDPSREVYFWHAAAYWGVGKRLPSTYELDGSERVSLNLATKMPYREHQRVLARYPNPTSDAAIASVPTNDR